MELGVQFVTYSGPGTAVESRHKFIIVSADKAHTLEFIHFICNIDVSRPVRRFYFDEAHLVLTARHYRPKLDRIYELRRLPVQWILLSGTIPPSSIAALIDAFLLHPKTLTIREPTNRPELRYIIQPKADSDEQLISESLKIYQRHIHQFSDRDRALIFVPRMDLGFLLAAALQCNFFSGHGSVTLEAKEEMYEHWRTGKNQVLVCTSAFGAGNDYPHVRLTIHAGTPSELVNFVQEIGRAGRDRLPASSYVIPRGTKFNQPPPGSIDHWGYDAIKDYITKASGCLRHKITSFTDGNDQGVSCSPVSGDQPCSFCDPSSVVMPQDSTGSTASVGHLHSLNAPVSSPVSSSPPLSSYETALNLPFELSDTSLHHSLPATSTLGTPSSLVSGPQPARVNSQLFNSSPSNPPSAYSCTNSIHSPPPKPTPHTPSHPTCSSSSISSFPLSQKTNISSFSSESSEVLGKRKSGDVFEQQVVRAKHRRMNQSTGHHIYVRRLARALAQVKHTCTFCLVQQQRSDDHNALRCPIFANTWSLHVEWRKTVQYNKRVHGYVCFFCHVPQIDDSIHPYIAKDLDCPYKDIILPLIWSIFHNQDHRPAAELFFNTSFPTVRSLAAWLRAPPIAGHPTNTVAMFLWFIEHRN